MQALRQATSVATTEALALHQKLTTRIRHPLPVPSQTAITTVTALSAETPTVSAGSGLVAPIVHAIAPAQRHELLFYKPTTSSCQRLEARKRSAASNTMASSTGNIFLAPPNLTRSTPSLSSLSVSSVVHHRVVPALMHSSGMSSASVLTGVTTPRHSPCGDHIGGSAVVSFLWVSWL